MSVRERNSAASLANGVVLTDLLRRAFKRAERRSEYLFALLVIGLDRSHSACDGVGAPGVDPTMTYVARRLQASLRATDAISPEEREMTLGRLDGDEFTVLLEDIKSAGDASLVADRLQGRAAVSV